jgi:hypothetical protein
MGNINAPEIEYFQSFADEIASKFQRVKRLVDHRVSSGNYHEVILRTVLRNFLSKRYSVKTGFIYKDNDHVSNQMDILIIDENTPAAYIFQEDDFVIVMPNAVVAAIEVKTTLNAGDFDTALENIASAKRLFDLPAQLRTIIFSYQGTPASEANLDAWFKRRAATAIKDEPVLGPHAISFFEQRTLMMRFNPVNNAINDGHNYHKICQYEDDPNKNENGWHLSLLLALILGACEDRQVRLTGRFLGESHAGKLIQSQNSFVDEQGYGLGIGKISPLATKE